MPNNQLADPTFDPWVCHWCEDTGFDLRGLAHHVWMDCPVVERLAKENIEDCRRAHEKLVESIRARQS